MVDVYWEKHGERRYLQSGEWSLDPDSGQDTVDSLRQDAEELNAAADFLEAEEADRKARAVRDQRAGRMHAVYPPRLYAGQAMGSLSGPYLGQATESQRQVFYSFDEYAGFDTRQGRAFLDRVIRALSKVSSPLGRVQ